MAPSDLTQHFAPILQLGSVYLFQDVTSSSPDFWVDAFEFSPFSSLQSHIRASVYLTDVVGVSITCVSSTVTSFGSTVRSDLVLQNENLWGGIARTLNGQDLVVLGHSDPILLVVCSLWVTSATRGGYSLTSTPDTRYVLNPVSEMSHLVQSVFFSSTNTVHYYPPRFATPHEEAAFEAECTKTVSQLLALCFPPVADGYYLGYALCSKAAIDYDGVDKWCDDHHFLVPQQAQNFYKLRATVDDTTGSAVFVLLGRAADLLVGLTAHDLSASSPMLPVSSMQSVLSMRASAMDPVSSADSPSGSSQTAFSTPPRHPYIRRIPTGSSSTSVALGSMNSEVPSPQLARVGPVSYARPRTEAVLRQTGPPPEPQELETANAEVSTQNKTGRSKKTTSKKTPLKTIILNQASPRFPLCKKLFFRTKKRRKTPNTIEAEQKSACEPYTCTPSALGCLF